MVPWVGLQCVNEVFLVILTCFFGYNTIMLWLPNSFIMEFYKGIIGK